MSWEYRWCTGRTVKLQPYVLSTIWSVYKWTKECEIFNSVTNRIEDPEMNPHTYGHLIFDKGAENIQSKKDSLFNKWCSFSWRSACRRMQIDPYLSPWTKLHSKWIKDLHIKPDTRKLIEKKLGKTLEDIGTGEKFLNRTPIVML